jgi:hypothetical protein
MPGAPTDLELVDLTAALYAPPVGLFDQIVQIDPMAPYIGVKHCDGYDVAIPRGSKTLDDWDRDAESEIGHVVKGYEVLGLLPYGFSLHFVESYAALAKVLRPGVPLAFGAHSLACPEACYLAAAHVLAKGQLRRMALFEPPNPGTAHLTAFFARDDVSPWWNQGDWVPDAPMPIPPFLPWCPVRPARRFDVAPPAGDKSLLPRHGIALCQQAVRAASV